MDMARILRRFGLRAAVALVTAAIALGISSLSVRAQMPDPREMSGIPRPVTDLPNGSVAVRVIRGQLTNNIANQPVELSVDGKPQTVNTDAEGRAQFDRLPAGAMLKASTTVDGERIESETFPAPSQGAIRLLLVATDKNAPSAPAAATTAPSAPAVAGAVTIGGESRIVIEPGEESVSIFYILDIVNPGQAPVNPPLPFEFDVPEGMTGTGLMQGSSPRASVNGHHVTVAGPFPPGKTSIELGGVLPVPDGEITFSQRFPANYDQPVFIAKKEGALKVSSPQFDRQQDTAVENTPVIIGAGSAIAAGTPFTMTLSGLPHHSPMPRLISLALAAVVAAIGLIAAWSPAKDDAPAVEQKKLAGRRERLMQDLVKLEQDHRRGKVDDGRFAARREELMSALEGVYAALVGAS